MSNKIAVVVPSNRPEKLVEFKENWAKSLEESEAKLYVIEDQEETWTAIKRDLGRNAWIIPCRTDCIRSYGYLNALRDGANYIVTLDDDVKPLDGQNPIIEHINQLNRVVEPDNWVRTLRTLDAPPTRGLPLIRPVVVNHGLWVGVPDVSAKTQLEGSISYEDMDLVNEQIIPSGKLFPMSGMNLSWVSGVTPLMYFGLQGSDIRDPEKKWGIDRCGDIFAGVVSKSIIDAHGGAVHSGTPYVRHDRASDPKVNLEKERSGEHFSFLLGVQIRGVSTYREVASRLHTMKIISKLYCKQLAEAMRIWEELCKKG